MGFFNFFIPVLLILSMLAPSQAKAQDEDEDKIDTLVRDNKFGIMANQMNAGNYTVFYEYDLPQYIGLNVGAGLGYDYNKLSGKTLDEKNYHELNHTFLLVPVTVRFYPFAADLCIFLGAELDIRLSTTPKTVGAPERSNESIKDKSVLNSTQWKWCVGLDYEILFGIILGVRYANVLNNFVNPTADEQLFNTSNLQVVLGINLARIF